jgi:glycosyltransferase involved in cell wall biosynthesis
MSSQKPAFSIVINTDGRAQTIGATLSSLLHLDYPNFEVCIVIGPTDDGTEAIVQTFGGAFKIARCTERNLSVSRNIGIAMASGDVIAFIDDDAVPEPEWLSDLAADYGDSSVGAVGGFVYDHTGVNFQCGFVTVNRLGRPDTSWNRPADELNFPYSESFPHLLGTNASFLKKALLDIGGFDEEYEYFLDETDVCCRIIDGGYRIIQSHAAFVHHKYAPSATRDVGKVVRRWYPLIKNRVYFALKNGINHHSFTDCIKAGIDDVNTWNLSIEYGLAHGYYSQADADRYETESAKAIKDGIERGSRTGRKLLSDETLAKYASPFKKVVTLNPIGGRKNICFISQDYPPGQNGGIARYIHQLATTLGQRGYNIHVITKGVGHDRVDYEAGVWVHRLVPKHFDIPEQTCISPQVVPQHIWNWSNTALRTVEAIDARRGVDIVYAPVWDCEGIAFLDHPNLKLITSLQTTMKHWLQSYTDRKNDENWMRIFGNPILGMEKEIIARSWKIHSISKAIANDVKDLYGLDIDHRVLIAPIGLEDWNTKASPEREGEQINLLFVGRLEKRKGIDILLNIAPQLLTQFPNATLNIVGDDTIPVADTTYRNIFEAENYDKSISERVIFHGRQTEDELISFYRTCSIFIAPSRYESFGLISLEAMMFAKPVVACRTGGMPEVVEDGVTGILAEPGDPASLLSALSKLMSDSAYAKKLGRAGRLRYEQYFTNEAMADYFQPVLRNLDDSYGNLASDLPRVISSRLD